MARDLAAIVCKTSRMADRLVTAAIDHWAPRFIANGVDANDFTRITGAIG